MRGLSQGNRLDNVARALPSLMGRVIFPTYQSWTDGRHTRGILMTRANCLYTPMKQLNDCAPE